MEAIRGFFGSYRWLSNFWPAVVKMSGLVFPSVENAYQAAKTLDPGVRKWLSEVSPSKAKQIGKTLRVREDWEQIKLQVMYELVRYKFTCNLELKTRLIKTGDAYLEETNTWRDKFWGVFNGQGENHMGKILMRIRKEICDG